MRLHSLDRVTSNGHAAVTMAKSGNVESGGEEATNKHRLTDCQESRTVISTDRNPERSLQTTLARGHLEMGFFLPENPQQLLNLTHTHVRVSVTIHIVLGYLFLFFTP